MLALPLVVVFSNSDSDGTVVGSVVTAACAAGCWFQSVVELCIRIRHSASTDGCYSLLSAFFLFLFFPFFLFAGKKMSEERALAVAVVIPCEEER